MNNGNEKKIFGTIKTDFPGLIQLLAKNLYPRDDMFVRELIQNAHDAIIKRLKFDSGHAGRIDIFADRNYKKIVFKDNGAGMTEAEIIEYLATIGKSGTRDLRNSLKEKDRNLAQSLIGQFGIGILSAFVAAEMIIVETRSAEDQNGLRWIVRGGPEYELDLITKSEVGTNVTLCVKPEYVSMTNPDVLKKAVQVYADFLPFPIYINDDGPINTMQAPWHRGYSNEEERRKTYLAYVQARFEDDIALEIIPIDIEAPHIIKGVLYISDRHIPDVDVAGMVDIYQARMFICEGDHGILPPWAKFIRGIIDSPALMPTAARDSVQEDRVYEEIRGALGRLIIDTLQELAKKDPIRFRRLMQWHHYHIMGMALKFPDFFGEIADLAVFEVNLLDPKTDFATYKKLTLPEYLQLHNVTDEKGRKVIYYINEIGAVPQFNRLCQAKGLIAINASSVFDEEFLKRYADKNSKYITLKRVNIAEGESIFEPLSSKEREQYANLEYRLITLLRAKLPDQDTIIKTERFKPIEIPAVLTQTEESELANKLQDLACHPAFSNAVSEAMIEAFGIQQKRLKPVVMHLNASSPLISRLRLEDFDDPVIQDAWMTVYNNAFMYSRQYLSAQNLEVLHSQTIRALENSFALREENRKLITRISDLEKKILPSDRQQLTPHVSLFVMMPFDEEYRILEQALRNILEDKPYFFQVILARDRRLHQNLFDNIKSHMKKVHGFLADVSDLNPNVMLELGIAEVDVQERPVIILRRRGSKEPPADLKGRLYLEYDTPSRESSNQISDLENFLRERIEKIEAIELLGENRSMRYDSVTYLLKRFDRLTKDEAEEISKAFPSIEDLEIANKYDIRDNAHLDAGIAAYIEEELNKDKN